MLQGPKTLWRRAHSRLSELGTQLDSGPAMAITLALLFAAGVLILLTNVALASGMGSADRIGNVGVAAVGIAVAIGMVVARHHVGRRWINAMLALGTACVTVILLLTAHDPIEAEMFYIWVAIYAASFLSARAAVLQIGLVAAAYA